MLAGTQRGWSVAPALLPSSDSYHQVRSLTFCGCYCSCQHVPDNWIEPVTLDVITRVYTRGSKRIINSLANESNRFP